MTASDVVPAPASWPADASELPEAAERIGPVSWQATRKLLVGVGLK